MHVSSIFSIFAEQKIQNTMKKIFIFIAAIAMLSACSSNSQYQQTKQADINALTKVAAFKMPKVTVPSFPDRTFNVLNYGADATGQSLCSAAIQAAIDACTEAGGGTVIIPDGVYLTGPIVLKSNVRLYTTRNAFVLFSHDFKLYPIYDASFEGVNTKRCQSPLSARDAENIAITGEGTFNGSGDYWRPLKKSKVTGNQWKNQLKKGGVLSDDGNIWYPDEGSKYAISLCKDQNVPEPETPENFDWETIHSFLRPVMLHFIGCKNILLEGVCFENSPAWNLHPFMCENLILRNLTVRNPWYSQNGDGVDVESCKNVVIDHCSFDVGDDAICMKSGKNEDGRRRGIPTENVVVNGCTVYHGHGGFVVGSEMSGGIKNIDVNDCLFLGTDVGLRFKSTRGRGGMVEDIYIRNINMWAIPNEALLFDLFYGGKGAGEETEEEIAARMNAEAPPVSEETPGFRNIYIEDVLAKDVKTAIYFNGLPEMKIQNVNLKNITMSGERGAIIRQTNGLTVENVNIISKGEAWTIAPTVENVNFK